MDGMQGCTVINWSGADSTAVEVEKDLHRGPWTVEEDRLLANYISGNGEGRWNTLAICSGLKRTGKSCRLRWLNYLRPDIRRGNITPEEQIPILQLHFRWGNRWSKIAEHLPGRTDNEIKNYWRTRVQRHARKLHCDVNSKKFRDVLRHLWIPRLLDRIHQDAAATATSADDDYVKQPQLIGNNIQVKDDDHGHHEFMMQRQLLDIPNPAGIALPSPSPSPSVVEGQDRRSTGGGLCGWFNELSEALPSLNMQQYRWQLQ